MKNIILGTAGHIDHGKSALVKALTGIDPDRLKEEKQRGITIDLGFADLHYPDLTVGIVDVPGHERLIRNMLAGAGGIDMVLLVIAADEGVMPQSREHLAICNLLGINAGMIVITKIDLVDEEFLELVRSDIEDFVRGTFLEGAEIVPVSSVRGDNIPFLKERIYELAKRVKPKSSLGLFRLPIDRVFTLKGFGTIVTGTAISGSLATEDQVEILPAGISSRVRGLQSHGQSIKKAYAGQRVAINLQGVEKEQIHRGDVVVSPGRFRLTKAVDVRIDLLEDAPVLKDKSVVHFHLATSEVLGRVILYDREELKPGESGFAQVRLDRPLIGVSGDRFIIRRFSPVQTIGGGIILDSLARRRRRKEGLDDLKTYLEGTLKEKISTKIRKMGQRGVSPQLIEGWINRDLPEIREAVKTLLSNGEIFSYDDTLIHRDIYNSFRERFLDALRRFHKNNPLKPGMQKEVLRSLFGLPQKSFNGLISLMDEIVVEKDLIKLKEFSISVTGQFQELKDQITGLLRKEGFQPPDKKDIAEYTGKSLKEIEDVLKLMAKEGKLKRVTDSYYLLSEDYEKMLSLLRRHFEVKDTMSVGEFRDLLGTTRKFALPFLEHLDSNRVTMRVGDVRKAHPSFKKGEGGNSG
ncbi:MAG: selenocysteine-specific translation elongation factor [Nitrospirae bacterium]|nr:MAG: selenocysteine-specific translation elongation factor [Nitrospirota bacterium]